MSIPVSDVVAIEQAGDTLVRAINAGDISALAEFFTPNAVVLPPGRAFIQGSMLTSFFRNMAMRNGGLKLLSVDMEPFGADAVRDTGTLSMRLKQQQNGERTGYKYLMLWQKLGAEWKLASMVWNRAPEGRRGDGEADGDM